ncbi:Tad domain-containing protein [Allohahella marinimesophila]|uniref:Putative Flp pilus-assembly TadG-like N-terminal domain-containing protein n=1 Tax=Allohahella marinimesophila TaxID=1054972 RepID=A0ABP7PNW6_9GAMM
MRRLKRISDSSTQQGNVLVFSTLFMATVCLAFLQIYDTGKISLEKTRLQNIADSAAYSAAVLQARELNFHSYMNRAMVVNQSAIGQMVAISSYMQIAQQSQYNADILLEKIPVVGPFFRAAEIALGTINMTTQIAASTTTFTLDTLIGLFSKASLAWHASTTVQLAESIPALVKDNDPAAEVNAASAFYMVSDLAAFNRFTRRWSVEDTEIGSATPADRAESRRQFDSFRNMVLASRDEFVKKRSNTFFNARLIKMVQRGGTEFGRVPGKTNPYYSWSAVDTLSVHTRDLGGLFGGDWNEALPVAWGRQATHHDTAFEWSSVNSNGWNKAARTNRYAWQSNQLRDLAGEQFFEGKRNTPEHIAHYKVGEGRNNGFGMPAPGVTTGANVHGLRDFYQLRTPTREEMDTGISGSPIFRVLIQKPLTAIKDSSRNDTIVRQDGKLALRTADARTAALGNMHATAAAKAVYERSSDLWRRRDNRYELANLYNPFWYPRLAEFEGKSALTAAITGLDAVGQ